MCCMTQSESLADCFTDLILRGDLLNTVSTTSDCFSGRLKQKEKMRCNLKCLRICSGSAEGFLFFNMFRLDVSGRIFVWWHQGQWGGFFDFVMGLNTWLSLRRGVQHAHVLPAKSDTCNYLADAKCVRSWSGNYHPWHWLCFSISSFFFLKCIGLTSRSELTRCHVPVSAGRTDSKFNLWCLQMFHFTHQLSECYKPSLVGDQKLWNSYCITFSNVTFVRISGSAFLTESGPSEIWNDSSIFLVDQNWI